MFDERSVNLTSDYILFTRQDLQQTRQIWKKALVPLIEAAMERLQYEWDKQAKIEIGYNTFVLKQDESGAYVWSEIDPLTDTEWDEEADLEPEESASSSTVQTEQTASSSTPQAEESTVQAEQTASSSIPQTEQTASSSTPQTEESTAQTEQTATSSSPVPAPEHIDPEHWHEIVVNSAVKEEIAALNFKSLHQDSVEGVNQAWEYLMYSKSLERRNDGRLKNIKTYSHIEFGGWWCSSGVDPRSFPTLKPGEVPPQKLWGCLKPNQKREKPEQHIDSPHYFKFLQDDKPSPSPAEHSNKPKEFIKYEHPPKTPLSIFLLDVPDDTANLIYQRAGVSPSESDRRSGFWYCVWKHNVPIIVTEGAKKAASLLSQGHAAIGLPGINAGYQTKDEQSNPIPIQLREEFAMFATPGRDIKLCFDHDTKPKTIVNVHQALLKTGLLLQRAGANVSVINLPGPDKGVDDFIVNNGSEKLQDLVSKAQLLKEWYENNPPLDLRFLIKLKNGQILNLYEKQLDGTVTSNPANLKEEEIAQAIPQTPAEEKQQGGNEGTFSPAQAHPCTSASSFSSTTGAVSPPQSVTVASQYWANEQKVPNYALTIPRKLLVEKENKDIALTAKQLLDNYGVELDDGSMVYRSEAFSVRKFRDTYSIHRADDEQNSYFSNPLMQFEIDKKGKAVITKKPERMLMVERQEFLKVNNNLKTVEKLPSFYEDAVTLKTQLGSLAPLGTQAVIKRLEITEVSQLLSYSLKTAQSKHLKIGNYRIKLEINQQTGDENIRLIKKENDGLDREAIKINLRTKEAAVMKVSQQDIENLRLIAKRIQLEYSHQEQEIPNYIPSPSGQNAAVKTTPPHVNANAKYSPANPEAQENKRPPLRQNSKSSSPDIEL
ncbi:DUF3854 domain-containing protein [Nostoc sp. FACHB-280]|uniref:DUF3854 domain-containing protein n=1 Tax=Nostoc sp. FACHB-280 TaxID=2692839 RepID=UPI00168B4B60|nr:DUF3854 domain-containing protein [Nostoc sp. FACHB-280]MBD2498344.1 DUF3854 domain-containing protein [Nostoc sp. FACHB-280]